MSAATESGSLSTKEWDVLRMRGDFELYMVNEMEAGGELDWQPERNCYREFHVHFAFQAWRRATEVERARCLEIASGHARGAMILGFKEKARIALSIEAEIGPSEEAAVQERSQTQGAE